MRDLTKPKRAKERHNIVFPVLLIAVAIILIVLASKIFAQSSTVKKTAQTPTDNTIENQVGETNQASEEMKINDVLLSEYIGERKKLIEGINNYTLGAVNPKITIVEFADFACSFCKESYPKINFLALKYKDDVKIIFRDRPAFENSIPLALAGHCAGEQGRFWEMHNKLYENQSDSFGLDYQGIAPVAAEITGLNQKQFTDCMQNEKYINKIKKNLVDSEDLGVTGTPYFFVNGQPLAGDQPIEIWEGIIQELLR
ncbi:MAG: DsbA family protein [bacterium]